MRTFSFEKLNIWQKSRELSSHIYTITKTFLAYDKLGFTSQMPSCTISISPNIIEATSRSRTKNKARFTEISYGVTMELLNQVILSNDLNFIKQEEFKTPRNTISKIAAMLDVLYRAQIK